LQAPELKINLEHDHVHKKILLHLHVIEKLATNMTDKGFGTHTNDLTLLLSTAS